MHMQGNKSTRLDTHMLCSKQMTNVNADRFSNLLHHQLPVAAVADRWLSRCQGLLEARLHPQRESPRRHSQQLAQQLPDRATLMHLLSVLSLPSQ
jgi:hypothetical protein